MPNSPIQTHKPYDQKNVKGEISYESQTTPSEKKTQCEVTVPPKYIVPIIFIPGIMGTNLKNDKDQKVWYPGLGTLRKYSVRDATERQIALNPKTTQVGYDGKVKLSKKIPHITQEVAIARGWGSVISSGYPKVLKYLERHLNTPFLSADQQKKLKAGGFKGTKEWAKIVEPGAENSPELLGKWLGQTAVDLIKKEMHDKFGDYAMPVFACGYNWLDTNMESANYIAARMDNEILTQVKSEFGKCAEIKKFIIVTHSMGG